MLSLLHIENIAVIESADITFDKCLNVLTGETGAGKSIVIDALGAVLGGRASRELIRAGCERASIWALFHGVERNEELDIGAEGELLLSREILADGRNICKIDGKPATVARLRELGALLVQSHGQHDNYALLSENTHLELLDAFGEISYEDYRRAYREYQNILTEIGKLNIDNEEKQRKIDILKYSIDELETAEIYIGEEDELTARKKRLQNAEKLREALVTARESLSGGEEGAGAVGLIGEAAAALSSVSAYGEGFGALSEKLHELLYSLEDCREELYSIEDDSEEGDIDGIESRLDVYYKLKRKYNCSADELCGLLEKYQGELEGILLSEETLSTFNKQLKICEKQLNREGDKLSSARRKVKAEIEKRMKEELFDLDMAKAVFEVKIASKTPSPNGADEVSFLFSANPGEGLKPLSKAASGGELARVMLALKNLQGGDVPTLIFDEVDAGVSGRAAQKVAQKLCSVSRGRQVLCVTHLAQIAAMADTHFCITKDVKGSRTLTDVKILDRKGKAREIARLTGGSLITDITLKSAEELIEQGEKFKGELL